MPKNYLIFEGRGKKEEGRRKKEEGMGKEEGRRKKKVYTIRVLFIGI
jgi:hypothetical protein